MPSAVGDERARARAAARARRARRCCLRPVDEVGDDQEVAGEAHLHDGPDLELEPRDVFGALALARRGVGIQLREPRSRPAAASLRRWSSSVTPVGRRESAAGGSCRAESSGCSAARSRRVLASACGRSANVAAISRLRLEVLLGREAPRPARIGEHVAFGDADARLVRAEIRRGAGTAPDASRPPAAPSSPASAHRRGDQRVVVGVARRAAPRGSSGPGKRAAHARAALARRRRVALQQRLPDVAVARARQRDQAVGAFVEPLAAKLRAAAMLVACDRRASASRTACR